jgi:LacI family transcriptional regulator
MASIKDIARLSGCATSTVSRVLNNRDHVAPETRKRIQDAIRRLDYKPSLTAQSLRAKRGRLIGLAIPSAVSGAFAQVIQHALDITHAHGYNLVLANTHEDPDREESLIGDFLRRNIGGIIFSRVSDDSKILKKIVRLNIPVVVIDRALEHEKVSNVVLDNRAAGRLAGAHLAGLGHRKIACIMGPRNIGLCRERLAGFRAAIEGAGLSLPEDSVVEAEFSLESGITAVAELARRGVDYTAVWAMNDWMALGAMRAIQQGGRPVPQEVSMAGMDDTEIALASTPPLTSIHYPFGELVEKAVGLLLTQISRGGAIQEIVVLQPSLVVRGSTAHSPEGPQV